MKRKKTNPQSPASQRGQSLIETAILVPLLFMILFNGINIAYFWFMILQLSSIPRLGVEFASQGGQAIATTSTPTTDLVSELVYENLSNSIGASDSNAQVRVCSSSEGVNSATHVAVCKSFGPTLTGFSAVAPDPESPVFVLHRVDVAYKVTPLIPGTLFNIVVPSNLTFHRQVSMRSLY